MKTGNNLASFCFLGWCLVLTSGAGMAEEVLEPIVVRRALPEASMWISADEIRLRGAQTPEDILSVLGADIQKRGAAGAKSDISLEASTFQQVRRRPPSNTERTAWAAR
jgi:hypothetical protein